MPTPADKRKTRQRKPRYAKTKRDVEQVELLIQRMTDACDELESASVEDIFRALSTMTSRCIEHMCKHADPVQRFAIQKLAFSVADALKLSALVADSGTHIV